MPTRLERLTSYMLHHRWQTLVVLFFASFVPVLGLMGTLAATLVTLVKGMAEGAILMLTATLPFIVSFFVLGNHDAALPLAAWAAVGVAVLGNLLTWVFATMLFHKASWSTLLQVAALIGVLVISVIHLIYPDVADWWGSQLQASYEQAQAVTTKLKDAASDMVTVPNLGDDQQQAIQFTRHYATGLMAAAVLFNAVIQLLVARWWQAQVFTPGMLKRELHNIRLSKLAGVLFVLALALSYWGNSVISDILPVVYLLFAAAGLSLAHYLIGLIRTPMVWFWLTLMYISIIVTMPIGLWIVSMLGLADVWMDIRKRIGIRIN